MKAQTHVYRSGLSWFSKSETIETNWSRDGSRLKSDNMRRSCRHQDNGALQGQSGCRQHVVAHNCSGREVRLARSGILEHEALSGHEMRSPAGTGRGGDPMAAGWQGQSAGKEEGGGDSGAVSCYHRHVFLRFTFLFLVSMKEVANIGLSVIAVRKKSGQIRAHIDIRTYAQKKGGGWFRGAEERGYRGLG